MTYILPRFELTEVVEADCLDAKCITLPGGPPAQYHIRPVNEDGLRCNFYPVVTDANRVPWGEANLWLMSRLRDADADVTTITNAAGDLTAYRIWCDENGIDWLKFPEHRKFRPTYRFQGFLRTAIRTLEIKPSTGARQISTVVAFYKWLMAEKVLFLDNPPWEDRDKFVHYKDVKGFEQTKKVASHDLTIKVPNSESNDVMEQTIDDGGKLRPMPKDEQEWLLEALKHFGNTEMTLIHLVGLLTGARIQTILTMRVRHVLKEVKGEDEIKLRAGPGYGIDTKFNKHIVLYIPAYLYKKLQTYALSNRARMRRAKAKGGDTPDQYLFLSNRGMPFYQCKSDIQTFDEDNERRTIKRGETVRTYIAESVIPYIRETFNAPTFRYQFHDTRASFGMNLTEAQLGLVQEGKITLFEAREIVKTRMCHESAEVTDRYLKFNGRLELARQLNDCYAEHLRDGIDALLVED